MLFLISTIHVIVCLFLILVVLLQQGKGADLSVFGGGGSQAAFGARGATTFLHKLTVAGFVGFILTTMAIGLLKTSAGSSSVMSDMTDPAAVTEEFAAEEPDAMATDAAAAADAAEAMAPDSTEPMADDAGAAPATDDEAGSDGDGG